MDEFCDLLFASANVDYYIPALRIPSGFDSSVSSNVRSARLLREALEIARPALGDAHPRTAEYMANLARVYLAQGQAAAAQPLVRRAVEIRRRVLPEGNWQTASAESLLGAVLTAQGRYAEAEPLLLGAQRVLKDIPGAQGRKLGKTECASPR